MDSTSLHIKNMVCSRCIKVVTDEFKKLGLNIKKIELGKVKVASEISPESIKQIRKVLQDNGFELIDDKKVLIINKIKTIIVEKIHYSKSTLETVKWSNYISKEIGKDYSYLSKLFSDVEGTTIEKYIINQKIEKVKELLVYDEMSLNEISYQLGYSSVQHLSVQFKKATGLTPSQFKKLNENQRKPLDNV